MHHCYIIKLIRKISISCRRLLSSYEESPRKFLAPLVNHRYIYYGPYEYPNHTRTVKTVWCELIMSDRTCMVCLTVRVYSYGVTFLTQKLR